MDFYKKHLIRLIQHHLSNYFNIGVLLLKENSIEEIKKDFSYFYETFKEYIESNSVISLYDNDKNPNYNLINKIKDFIKNGKNFSDGDDIKFAKHIYYSTPMLSDPISKEIGQIVPAFKLFRKIYVLNSIYKVQNTNDEHIIKHPLGFLEVGKKNSFFDENIIFVISGCFDKDELLKECEDFPVEFLIEKKIGEFLDFIEENLCEDNKKFQVDERLYILTQLKAYEYMYREKIEEKINIIVNAMMNLQEIIKNSFDNEIELFLKKIQNHEIKNLLDSLLLIKSNSWNNKIDSFVLRHLQCNDFAYIKQHHFKQIQDIYTPPETYKYTLIKPLAHNNKRKYATRITITLTTNKDKCPFRLINETKIELVDKKIELNNTEEKSLSCIELKYEPNNTNYSGEINSKLEKTKKLLVDELKTFFDSKRRLVNAQIDSRGIVQLNFLKSQLEKHIANDKSEEAYKEICKWLIRNYPADLSVYYEYRSIDDRLEPVALYFDSENSYFQNKTEKEYKEHIKDEMDKSIKKNKNRNEIAAYRSLDNLSIESVFKSEEPFKIFADKIESQVENVNGFKDILAIPLKYGIKPIGVILLASILPRQFQYRERLQLAFHTKLLKQTLFDLKTKGIMENVYETLNNKIRSIERDDSNGKLDYNDFANNIAEFFCFKGAVILWNTAPYNSANKAYEIIGFSKNIKLKEENKAFHDSMEIFDNTGDVIRLADEKEKKNINEIIKEDNFKRYYIITLLREESLDNNTQGIIILPDDSEYYIPINESLKSIVKLYIDKYFHLIIESINTLAIKMNTEQTILKHETGGIFNSIEESVSNIKQELIRNNSLTKKISNKLALIDDKIEEGLSNIDAYSKISKNPKYLIEQRVKKTIKKTKPGYFDTNVFKCFNKSYKAYEKKLITDCGIELDCNYKAHKLSVDINYEILADVFRNILSNIYKYGKQDSKIKFSIYKKPTYWGAEIITVGLRLDDNLEKSSIDYNKIFQYKTRSNRFKEFARKEKEIKESNTSEDYANKGVGLFAAKTLMEEYDADLILSEYNIIDEKYAEYTFLLKFYIENVKDFYEFNK